MFKACDKVAAFMANEHNFWHLIKFTNETKKLKICSALYNFIETECLLRQNRTQGTKGYENQGTKKGTKRNENLEQNPLIKVKTFELDRTEPILIQTPEKSKNREEDVYSDTYIPITRSMTKEMRGGTPNFLTDSALKDQGPNDPRKDKDGVRWLTKRTHEQAQLVSLVRNHSHHIKKIARLEAEMCKNAQKLNESRDKFKEAVFAFSSDKIYESNLIRLFPEDFPSDPEE